MAGILPGYLQDMSSGGNHSRSASPARQLIAIDLWLDSLGLLEYLTLFSSYRYVQVRTVNVFHVFRIECIPDWLIEYSGVAV